MPVLIQNPPCLSPQKSLAVTAWVRDRLKAMQQTAASAPSLASPSFAGLLAALAAPGQQRSPVWSEDGLADDYATLSYERALRTHARCRPADASDNESDLSLTGSADSAPSRMRGISSSVAFPPEPAATPIAAPSPIPDPQSKATHGMAAALARNLKTASITIRVSETECAQLHRRAADAGLTVSAYLRSCTFEAESLRAMVKDTLAELRLAKAQTKPANPEPLRPSMFRRVAQWLRRLMTPWHGSPRIARA
jgi:hypothetical protein